jgi:hypothetical protein
MAANAFAGDHWHMVLDQIVAAVKSEDGAALENAKQLLSEKERKLDSYYSIIDKDTYVPKLRQGLTTDIALTAASTRVEGIRIGPWVQLNVMVVSNAAGVSGNIGVSLPALFPPITTTDVRAQGIFRGVDNGTAANNANGAAHIILESDGLYYVYGAADGTANLIGTTPTYAVAAGDFFSFSVQYQANVPSF